MENEYIRFFVDYYKNLHFDKIILYDNNDIDGEQFEEVIGDYVDNGFVEIVDYRSRTIAHLAAYQDCYDRYSNKFDWIAFFDCDEFLTFVDGTDDIHVFLGREEFLPYQLMHINWMVYGDNDLLDSDGNSVVDRFKEPVLPLDFKTRNHPWNEYAKSIVRGGLPTIKWMDTHTLYSSYYLCCNSEGIPVNTNSSIQRIEFRTVYLRHYRTKSIGEWVRNKMQRGFGDMPEKDWKEILTLDHFFEYNKKTKEKLDYANMVMEELKINQKQK